MNKRMIDRNPTLKSLMLGFSQLGVLKKTQPTKLILSTEVYRVYAMDPSGLAMGRFRGCRIFDHTV